VGEDEAIFRRGLVEVLEENGLDVVAVAADSDDLLRKVRAHVPDAVVTDVPMPPDRNDDALRAAREIRIAQPDVGVLVLASYVDDRHPVQLVGDRPDGVGYLLKDQIGDIMAFVHAVRQVAHGGMVLDPAATVRMFEARRGRTGLDDLTPREGDVLELIAQGCSNHGIATRLVVTVPAVERHVTRIFSKLDLPPNPERHRRVLAVLEYLRH
jgi:DNA-binding NarL/FixJ family response regulator